MGNSGSFLTRNVLRFSGRDWDKTKTKVEVSWLPSYCIHAVWGKRMFLTCRTMTSPEGRRAKVALPRSDAPRPRPRIAGHCSRVLGPVSHRHLQEPFRSRCVLTSPHRAGHTCLLKFPPQYIVSKVTGRTFVPPGSPIEASRFRAQPTSAKWAAEGQRAAPGLAQTPSCFLKVHDTLTDHVPGDSRHDHQRHK